MELLSDVVAVLGSRHGVVIEPHARRCGILRFDRFTRLPELGLRAGVVIDGEEVVLPLCPDGTLFDFVDQRTEPASLRLIGIHAATCLRVELRLAVPFRLRDADFSTVPVVALELAVSRVPGIFRWTPRDEERAPTVAFLEFAGERLELAPAADPAGIDLSFTSVRAECKPDFTDAWDTVDEAIVQHDRLLALAGERRGTRFEQPLDADGSARLAVAWCTWSPPTLRVHGELRPFRYAARLPDLNAVCAWAAAGGGEEILAEADAFGARCADHDLGQATDHLLAYTLHSWLANTWWAGPGIEDRREWYTTWEGSCYMHATVDVEFTQAPFYLACWPELLGLLLDQWPDFTRDGADLLGADGHQTRYLCHDSGAHASVGGQIYDHDMAVEESANYLILAVAHWRRSGDDTLLERHRATITAFLRFLAAADTTGTGVPDTGVANTLDDASPAVQFGREQVYLAVKTLAACTAGAVAAEHLGDAGLAADCRARAERIRARVEERGWLDDHYVVLLERGGTLINPWSGAAMDCAEIPGWDAAHIYTGNGLVPLDMVGLETGLDVERLRTDLRTAARRCLGTYGCAHSDFANRDMELHDGMLGLAGVAARPGWISMNLLRDLAAAYRGVDLTHLWQRYWEWQTTTNSRECNLFFETFAGNNLRFYPRGIAAWGLFDALAGRVVDRVASIDRCARPDLRVPRLLA